MKKRLRAVFENISGGLVLAGKAHGEMVFSRVSLNEYIECLREYEPDILSLSEVHMEDEKGRSEMVESIAKSLGFHYYKCFSQSPSHLDTSKRLGLAVLSKYPVVNYTSFFLPNPRLEIDKPDGSHWIMFDKGAQRLKLNVDERQVNVFNLHYFPFHHFKRCMNEDEFADSRQKLVDILLSESRIPTIVTGDFNNKGLTLDKAFPELFMRDRFTEAVRAKTTVIGLCEQFDHILYTPNTLEASHGFAELNLSDHYAVGTDFFFIQ